MSQTLNQIYVANPSTTMLSTDLMYLVHSPYTTGQDSAITYSNFATSLNIPTVTPAALTQANDTNVTLTLGGTPATALLQAASITAGWTGTLAGSRGGLGAAITANNGGIYYSNASTGALLSGTATATQMLQSGASTTPAWSTTTWPATSTINQLLYSSAANTISGLATSTTAVLTTSAGVPTWAASLSLALGGTNAALAASNGGIFYSTASAGAILAGTATAKLPLLSGATAAPTWGAFALTMGGAITTAGALTTSGAFASTFTMTGTTTVTFPTSGTLATTAQIGNSWVDQVSATVTMVTNTGYTADAGASLITFTLPTTSAIGDFVEINGKAAGLWKIAQAAGQQINISGGTATTAGVGGSLSSVGQFDCVRLRCLTANTIWTVVSQQSAGLTVV